MALREEVLEILRGPEASRIRFSFPSIFDTPVSVDQTTFLRVAGAIETNRIRINVLSPTRRIAGEYRSNSANGGEFFLRPIRNRRYNYSAILHEAVHASFDLTRSVIAAVDDEIAALLANTLYLRRSHYPLTRIGTESTRHLYESVWRAAASIESSGEATETQIEQIRTRLSRNPLYRPYVLSDGCFEEGGDCQYHVRHYNQ